MSYPSPTTVKKLAILSRNNCAFPNCQSELIHPDNLTVIGDICHIRARNPNGPRFDETQTEEERNAFENLILMCKVHHTVIDDDVVSYPVERLIQIKKDHESGNHNPVEPTINYEELTKRLLSEIVKEKSPSDHAQIVKEENSALLKAKKLAEKNQYEANRKKWFYSQEGRNDVINSVKAIFSLIESTYLENEDTYSQCGIELNKYKKNLYTINTPDFVSQIELEGITEDFQTLDPHLINIRLKIFLFKQVHRGNGIFNEKIVDNFHLSPNLSPDYQINWRKIGNEKYVYSERGICEKLFNLLLDQINKPLPLDETIAGGKFVVDGQYKNANGELIDDWGNIIDSNDDELGILI